MTVKKFSISLLDEIYKYAADKAESLFQGNISAYLGYLVSKEKEDERIKQEQNKKA